MDGHGGQPEECQCCCLGSRVAVGKAGNELRLLAAQVLREVDEACCQGVVNLSDKNYLLIASAIFWLQISSMAIAALASGVSR
jgi:hypothetical protein